MNYATAEKTNRPEAPALVTVGAHTTPVWLQRRWNDGPYKTYIQNNGCGHCCTVMALRLHGIVIDPHREYETCRLLWGAPDETECARQGHYMSVSGIVKILHHFGVPASCFGMDFGEETAAKSKIGAALSDGKQVIFWSHPSDRLIPNPFSDGEHYVLAAGYATADGDVLLANSSASKAPDGVQITNLTTIVAALYPGSRPSDKAWGDEDFPGCAGYVIVG